MYLAHMGICSEHKHQTIKATYIFTDLLKYALTAYITNVPVIHSYYTIKHMYIIPHINTYLNAHTQNTHIYSIYTPKTYK